MSKLPSPSPWPMNTVRSVVLSLRATNGFATGSPSVSWSNGGQPCQLRAVPVISPVPAVANGCGAQTKPNQYAVRAVGGSHSCSPGAPVPSAPSSVGASNWRPPSIVVVWYQRLFGSLLHGRSGGWTSMKYVAGTEVVDLVEAVTVGQAETAAQRLVVVVDRDRTVGLLLEADLESAQAGFLGVGCAVRPGVVLEHEDADLAQWQRVRRRSGRSGRRGRSASRPRRRRRAG